MRAPTAASQKRRVWKSKLRAGDAVRTGAHGLVSRKGRTVLTAIGIAIGISSLVAVIGLSSSSKAALLAQIDDLGTNLLQVQAGSSFSGGDTALPAAAPAMVRRIGPVEAASSVAQLEASVQRNEFTDNPNAIHLVATTPDVATTLGASVQVGRFLDASTSTLPDIVLGSVAATRLGITNLDGAPTVTVRGREFGVIGILDPLPLNPEIDRSVLIGEQAAITFLNAKIVPTTIYVRADPAQVTAVREVLARTANPQDPNEVSISRPSDALQARAQVDRNLQNLLLGLGAVALLVGGIGIANVMVISVLERRGEIGLRRALGATRVHIAMQFVLESAALAALGGVTGVGLGAAATVLYARHQHWMLDLPVAALGGGVLVALALGAFAGLYPATRAARLDPAEAVRPK